MSWRSSCIEPLVWNNPTHLLVNPGAVDIFLDKYRELFGDQERLLERWTRNGAGVWQPTYTSTAVLVNTELPTYVHTRSDGYAVRFPYHLEDQLHIETLPAKHAEIHWLEDAKGDLCGFPGIHGFHYGIIGDGLPARHHAFLEPFEGDMPPPPGR